MTAYQNTMIDWAKRTSLAKRLARVASSRTFYERLGVILFVAVVLMLSIVTWLRPGYNWDMVAYMGTALENRIEDPVALHAAAWKEIEKGAADEDLQKLRDTNEFSRQQWEDPASYRSVLSFYRIKIAYIALLRAVEPLTGLDKAAILLSIAPSMAFGAFCLWWLKRENALQGALLLVPILGVVDYLHMFTVVSPDAVATLISVMAVYLLSRRRDSVACCLLFASIVIRPDSLILVFAFLITAVMFGWRKTPFVVTFILGFVLCILISKWGGYPGWYRHFYFSLIHSPGTLENFNPAFSLAAIVQGYAKGAMVALSTNRWPAALLLLVMAWGLVYRTGKAGGPRFNALMFALAIATLGKFASFPLPEDRIYFFPIASMAILLIIAWKPRFDIELKG